MQPFRITCETCRSRLKIRSTDVIGQIHACPKCGSMVQIVPPPGWDAIAAAMPFDQPSAAGEAALTLSTTASVIIPATAMDDLSVAAAALEAPAAEGSAEMASSVLPPVEASSPVMLWSIGGVAAVFLLGGLSWAVWPRGSDKAVEPSPSVVAANDRQAGDEQSMEPKPATPLAEPPKPAARDAHAVQSKVEIGGTTQTASASAAAEPAAADTASEAAEPADPAPPVPSTVAANPENADATALTKVAVAEPSQVSTVPAPTPTAAEFATKAPDHSPVLKFDPLDFDVDRLGSNLAPTPDPRSSTNSIPDQAPIETAGNGVASDGAVSASTIIKQDKQAINATLPPVESNSVSVRRGPPGDAPQHTVGQLLAMRVKSFQVTDMPLARFVETMSGVAGTGITLDPVALDQVGISPRATVSVSAQDVPLQTILHEALGQRRLDIAEQGGQLRVALPTADEPHTIDYEVKDLVAGSDAAAIGKLIEHFVAPATWKSAGGKGAMQVNGTTLHIEQSDAVRRQVVIFCERLRLARGLVIQSKYPAALLSVESPYQRLSAKLGKPTTFTFLPWTRLDDVVRNWAEMSGILVLVDWSALAEVELGPSSPVACSAMDRPWQESLDGVLEPLGLGWWAADGETIQITSLSALDKLERVEFYQVPPKLRAAFASNQALADSLQKELSEPAGKQVKPTSAHMEVDEPSGRLIVLASPAVHRQLSHRLGGEAKQ